MKNVIRPILITLLILLSFIFQDVKAEFVPPYTNSISHWGIGAARVTNLITIYKEPDLNSEILERIYWNSAGNFITKNKKNGNNIQDIFIAYLPNENIAFLSADDENEEWIKVCYNQKNSLFGWVKKENNTQGAKFYLYRDLFFKYGKQYGIYTFRNLPPNYKILYGAPNNEAKKVDEFKYAKHISPWFVQGNWMLIKVLTYDNETKTGWFRWRSDEGRLYGFVDFK